jgi:hypothetical protein
MASMSRKTMAMLAFRKTPDARLRDLMAKGKGAKQAMLAILFEGERHNVCA